MLMLQNTKAKQKQQKKKKKTEITPTSKKMVRKWLKHFTPGRPENNFLRNFNSSSACANLKCHVTLYLFFIQTYYTITLCFDGRNH